MQKGDKVYHKSLRITGVVISKVGPHAVQVRREKEYTVQDFTTGGLSTHYIEAIETWPVRDCALLTYLGELPAA